MTSVSTSSRTNTLYLPPENAAPRATPSNRSEAKRTPASSGRCDGVIIGSKVADIIVPGYSNDSLTPVPGDATDIIPPNATSAQTVTVNKHTVDISRLNGPLTDEEKEALQSWFKALKANDAEIDGIPNKAKVAISVDGTAENTKYVTVKS
jgi:hypothetical protein